MADVRDEFGNPIQLTDERGKPVQLTDEFGNPMHLTGVAVHGGAGSDVAAVETKVETTVTGPLAAVDDSGVGGAEVERAHGKLEQSGSSNSSSSEDDGQGGRRKKKGLKEKIKEKLSVGKHKDKEEHAPYPTTVTSETRPGEPQTQHEHEKKSMIEKIKEKLPGHH